MSKVVNHCITCKDFKDCVQNGSKGKVIYCTNRTERVGK